MGRNKRVRHVFEYLRNRWRMGFGLLFDVRKELGTKHLDSALRRVR
jgi:hypothetical protein